MIDPPQNIRALREDRILELVWSPNRVDRLPFRVVREYCPCATCIDEITGQRILDVSRIPDDIQPTSMNFCGNYAIKIVWSDGHSTGLYTWDHLSQLGQAYANSTI
ncbi:MAG: DUF971 domain-containing protein [Planctomycetaceae bacterium]